MRFSWTPEAVATATRMVGEGATFSAIARAIGAPSRNAVIGKMRRLGVAQNPHDRKANQSHARRAPPPAKRSPAPATPPARASAPVPLEPLPLRPQASTAPGSACTLVHLDTVRLCRWPISGPEVAPADTLFCAAPREPGSTYCPTHRAQSGARQRTEAERQADEKRREGMARRYGGSAGRQGAWK